MPAPDYVSERFDGVVQAGVGSARIEGDDEAHAEDDRLAAHGFDRAAVAHGQTVTEEDDKHRQPSVFVATGNPSFLRFVFREAFSDRRDPIENVRSEASTSTTSPRSAPTAALRSRPRWSRTSPACSARPRRCRPRACPSPPGRSGP